MLRLTPTQIHASRPAGPLTGAEIFLVDQNGQTKGTVLSQIATLLGGLVVGEVVRTPVGNVDFSAAAIHNLLVLAAPLTAPRIWTLPAAAVVPAGHEITIQDEVGGVSATNTLTIAPALGDDIGGEAQIVLTEMHRGLVLRSNGTDSWAASILIHPSEPQADLFGPVGAVENNFPRFADASGKLLEDSGVNAASFAAAAHDHSIAQVTDLTAALAARVRHDAAQALTAAQRLQARNNIFAAPRDTLAYSGLQVNGNHELSQEWGTAGRSNFTGAMMVSDQWNLNSPTPVNAAHTVNAPINDPYGANSYAYATIATAKAVLDPGDQYRLIAGVEGWRWRFLRWGTPAGRPLTVGFWVYSSVPGVYTFAIFNQDGSRSRPFAYTVNAVNTWEFKLITVPPELTGTWKTNHENAAHLYFALGVGSSFEGAEGVWHTSHKLRVPGGINLMTTVNSFWAMTGFMCFAGEDVPSQENWWHAYRRRDETERECLRFWERRTVVPNTVNNYRSWHWAEAKRVQPGITWTFQSGTGATFIASIGDATKGFYQDAAHSVAAHAYVIGNARF